MIEFHAISLLDKEWIDRHLRCEDTPSADFNFGNMFIWDEHYRQLVCDFGERTLTKVRRPAAPGDRRPAGVRRGQGLPLPAARHHRAA